eukprot:11120323-Karenia_brevis.AAC.1
MVQDNGTKWRQFEDWAVSTTTQHITVKNIRWIRVNKSGQMLYVHKKMSCLPRNGRTRMKSAKRAVVP